MLGFASRVLPTIYPFPHWSSKNFLSDESEYKNLFIEDDCCMVILSKKKISRVASNFDQQREIQYNKYLEESIFLELRARITTKHNDQMTLTLYQGYSPPQNEWLKPKPLPLKI